MYWCDDWSSKGSFDCGSFDCGSVVFLDGSGRYDGDGTCACARVLSANTER